MTQATTDALCVNTIRTLSMDAIQKANSGHPGAPMGMAPAAYVLFTRYLKHNPSNPEWHDRDRFVLSAGHASMLIYSLLHLTGYDLSLDDIKNFRQWGSRTPGHPEYGHTPGVETTTGPLGQGLANAVGMAMAERFLASYFNRPGHPVVSHHTYCYCGDGCMMEGITHEAASLAGHLGLSKLICLYDDNKISIEGSTDIAFTEDVRARFAAYKWQVITVEDGNDLDAIAKAIEEAQEDKDRPSLIAIRSHIAFGSPHKQDSSDAHGAPLGEEEILLTKKNLGWPETEPFFVPQEALDVFRQCVDKGAKAEAEWNGAMAAFAKAHPEIAEQFTPIMNGDLPDGWDADIPAFTPEDNVIATRAASGAVLNAIAPKLPTLIGGSADLAPSNKTFINGSGEFQVMNYQNRNIRFGVREHAMGAIMSGMALHKGIRPYGGTFLVFADYVRPAIRVAALMGAPTIYVFTHDSVAVGEDGPTHQPVEHLLSLRAIPNLTVIRPSDATETAEAWKQAITNNSGPTALILSRQKLPVIDRNRYSGAQGLAYGAYVVADAKGKDPDCILIASGSEVSLALQAREQLAEKGVEARVVSMPSWELFEKTTEEYRNRVLPPKVAKRLAIEAGTTLGWERYVGADGKIIGIDRFGASAPGGEVLNKLGMNVENVVKNALEL
ncbi:transketolase [Desulfatibacillum alkenivorans DSM 16219]|jgi:transketolase|uniref:Transketolase n=1 Tax=Desulfatibacillum alkenivorans DSM 16219 TaxID=1121393 RepID=A0A1M6GYD5_9BACT|nr:transketolase [Desulfatibacillum alkenivorans]SHJ14973.1 transketolase [Desulfatibacillum alkenivorans DSM 16219]